MTAWCFSVLPTHTAPPDCLCWPTWPLPTLLLAVSSGICRPRCFSVRQLQEQYYINPYDIMLLLIAMRRPAGLKCPWQSPWLFEWLYEENRTRLCSAQLHIPGGRLPSVVPGIVESQTTIHASCWMHDFVAVCKQVTFTSSWLDCMQSGQHW